MCLDKAGIYYMQCVTAVSTIHQRRQNFPAMRKLSGEYRGYTLGYPVVFLCQCQVSPVQNHPSAAFQMSASVPQHTVSANLSLCFSQHLSALSFFFGGTFDGRRSSLRHTHGGCQKRGSHSLCRRLSKLWKGLDDFAL